MFEQGRIFALMTQCGINKETASGYCAKLTDLINQDVAEMDDDKPPGLDEIAMAAMQGILAGGAATPEQVASAAHEAWLVVVPKWTDARNEFIKLMSTQSP